MSFAVSWLKKTNLPATHRVSLSFLLTVSVMVGTQLWQGSLPLLSLAGCGPLLPHEHVVIGYASQWDLMAHESAESSCTLGHATSAPASPATRSPESGMILTIVNNDQQAPGTIVNVVLFAVVPLVWLLCQSHDARVIWWQARVTLFSRLTSLPPPIPPPKPVVPT